MSERPDEDRPWLNAADDPIGIALEKAAVDPICVGPFLSALATQDIQVILRQPPGPGDAAPERNLVQWGRADGSVLVPLFTDASRLPRALPAPAQLVRVSFRLLLSVAGAHPYVINPLSPVSWTLTDEHLTAVRNAINALGLSSVAPSKDAPWAFRLPDDRWFPVAYALAAWFVASGRVQVAYMYEMHRLNVAAATDLVLAIDERADSALARTLTRIATDAGAPTEQFSVRFLPDEPSHRAGVVGLNLAPFYRRPNSM